MQPEREGEAGETLTNAAEVGAGTWNERGAPKAQDAGAPHQHRSSRVRNLTGREVVLIYQNCDGTEGLRTLPRELTSVRVRYQRRYDPSPKEWIADEDETGGRIPIQESVPHVGILGTCESIDAIPPAEGGVRLLVDPPVVFALARRGIYRRDLVTLGKARFNPNTRALLGYESLNRINFDRDDDSAEVAALARHPGFGPSQGQ
jgi:hypothetical protein